jgi:hypothetical protein
MMLMATANGRKSCFPEPVEGLIQINPRWAWGVVYDSLVALPIVVFRCEMWPHEERP